MTDMDSVIQDKLSIIEDLFNVKILYAAESGSRAWGFASTDSDYDVRFIFKRSVQEYLSIERYNPVIDLENGLKDLNDEVLDFAGWDIYKTMGLFSKSNPPLIEWLQSPIIYREVGVIATKLRTLAQTDLSIVRFAHHHRNLAQGNWDTYIKGKHTVSHKKYLYILRSIFCAMWVLRHHTPPPTKLSEVLKGIVIPLDVALQLKSLLDMKMSGVECSLGKPNTILDQWIGTMLTVLSATIPKSMDQDWVDHKKLDQIILKELGINEYQ